MKVYEIISENTTLNELEIRGVPIPSGWIDDIINVIRRGGTAASVARKQLVDKLADKYAAELAVARKQGRPDPDVYATLKTELEAAADAVGKGLKEPQRSAAIEKAGLSGKELGNMLDDVVASAEKIYAKSGVAKSIAKDSPARAAQIEKAAATSKSAAYSAANRIAGLPKPIFRFLQGTGCVVAITAYYKKISYFEEEYNKYLANPNEGNIYREATSKDDAYRMYRSDCDRALGQLEIELLAILSPTVLAKAVKLAASFLSIFPPLGIAIKITTGIMSKLIGAANWIATKGGVNVTVKDLEKAGFAGIGAILTWIHTTEDGKYFMHYAMLGFITNTMGTVSREFFTKAAELAQKYTGPGSAVVNAAGKALGGTNAGGAGPQAPAQDPAEKAEQDRNANLPRTLRVVTQGKVKYLNNFQITDQNGKLLTGLESLIADTAKEAKQFGVPNPFDSIPKDPTKKYGIGL